MRCPFGYRDHPVTWRCYVAWVASGLANGSVEVLCKVGRRVLLAIERNVG